MNHILEFNDDLITCSCKLEFNNQDLAIKHRDDAQFEEYEKQKDNDKPKRGRPAKAAQESPKKEAQKIPEPLKSKSLGPTSIQTYLRSGAVKERVEERLGEQAGSFMTSLITAVNSNAVLQDCEPSSVLNSALTAASMGLPINQNLGFAYIVPYWDNKTKKRLAQFQMGWRGYVQLAQRTSQYSTVNVGDVREGEYKGVDRLTGAIDFAWVDDEAERQKLPVIGYFAYLKLHSGFEKILYMTVSDLEAHAKRYSQSYRKGYGLWVDNFPVMAYKTVIKLLIGKYGPMSIEIQKAIVADQAAAGAEDSFNYIDNQGKVAAIEPEEGQVVSGATNGD